MSRIIFSIAASLAALFFATNGSACPQHRVIVHRHGHTLNCRLDVNRHGDGFLNDCRIGR